MSLQKKYLLLILLIAITTLSTLPWIGLGDFYTKGEPREAVLAISMIEKGEWIIPSNYADEFAYKPPLNHWLISAFSIVLNNGEVTPFTSRLPSALAFIALVGACFLSFSKRRSVIEAIIACLILITCFELHRAATTTRIDMVLTFFMTASILQLFAWFEKRKLTQLLSSWLLLTFATLAKGPVGIVIPCVIFGLYQLAQGENILKTIWRCIYLSLPAFIIPFLWYYAAYQIHGEAFLTKVFAENFGRFFSMSAETLGTDYELGVENPWYYYVFSLMAGFLPWTILLIVSLFFINYKKPESIRSFFAGCFEKIKTMDQFSLYSFIVIVFSLLFFTVPSSKRSTYIMFIYPFIALFIARLFNYLTEKKPLAVRISTSILTIIGICIILVVSFSYIGILDIENISHHLSTRERTLCDMKVFSDLFKNPGGWGLFAITVILLAVWVAIHSLYKSKKQNMKILIAGFGMMFCINICLDSFFLPTFKNSYSPRAFSEYISAKYDLPGNTYVTNNLLKYNNLYGVNFYLHNIFRNFEKELPEKGYFFTLEYYVDNIKKEYGNQYEFTLLEKSDKFNEYKEPIILFKIKKKHPVIKE